VFFLQLNTLLVSQSKEALKAQDFVLKVLRHDCLPDGIGYTPSKSLRFVAEFTYFVFPSHVTVILAEIVTESTQFFG